MPAKSPSLEIFRLEEWCIRAPEGLASRPGQTVRLEPKLMSLLLCLARASPRVVSKDEILADVWRGAHVQEVVLSRGISELRRLLGDDARHPRLIETLPRRGYRLIGRLGPFEDPAERQEPGSGNGADPPTATVSQGPSPANLPSSAGRSRRKGGPKPLLPSVPWRWAIGLVIVLAAVAGLWIGSRPAPGSLAVLPFASINGDGELDAFCDGLTEDLIARLSELRGLQVVSRTTAMRYRGSPLDLRQIARRLRVASVLEGSVQRDGERVRIVVQLIDGAADRHRWSATYDREIRHRFDLQLDIVNRVAAEMQEALTPSASELLGRAPTEDVTAYDLYLRGRRHYLRYRPEENQAALELFRRATLAEPGFELAHAALASALALETASYGGELERAREALGIARHALSLAPELPEAHKAHGLALSQLGQPRRALAAYEKAIELRPGYEEALHNLAFLRHELDDWQDVGHWRPPAVITGWR